MVLNINQWYAIKDNPHDPFSTLRANFIHDHHDHALFVFDIDDGSAYCITINGYEQEVPSELWDLFVEIHG